MTERSHQLVMLKPMQTGVSGYARIQPEGRGLLMQVNLRGLTCKGIQVFWYCSGGEVKALGRAAANPRGEAGLIASAPSSRLAPERLQALLVVEDAPRPRPLMIGLCTAQSAGSLLDAKNASLSLCEKLSRMAQKEARQAEGIAQADVQRPMDHLQKAQQGGKRQAAAPAQADGAASSALKDGCGSQKAGMTDDAPLPDGTDVPGALASPDGTCVPGGAPFPNGTGVPSAAASPNGTCVPGAAVYRNGTDVPGAAPFPNGTCVPGAAPFPAVSATPPSAGDFTSLICADPATAGNQKIGQQALPDSASGKGCPSAARPSVPSLGKDDPPREIFLPALDPAPYMPAAPRPLTVPQLELLPPPVRHGVAVNQLPPLRWPEPFAPLKGYFERLMPCTVFDLPGWRFVCAANEGDGLWLGYWQRDGLVRRIAYAMRGASAPEEQPAYRMRQGLDGRLYRVLMQEL